MRASIRWRAARRLLAFGIGTTFALQPLRAAGADALLFIAAAGGERRSGSVTSCDDERCLVDRQAVALADLAWIGLGVDGAAIPAGVSAPGVVLADGAFRPGRFGGLSLGSVLLDADEIDRALVRWVRVAAVPPPVDVLVRRDGALRTGVLQGCAAESCTLSGQPLPRADLAWIGLGLSPEAIGVPTTPPDPRRDQAQFSDGTSRVTPLVGVGESDVVLGAGRFPRAAIAWVYLAPPAAPPADGPVHRPSPTAPGSPSPSSPPSSPPSGEPPPGRTQPPIASSGERGALWTGTLSARAFGNAHEIYSEWNVTIDVRLREYSSPFHCWSATRGEAPRVGTLIRLLPEGSVVTNSFRCSGPGLSCSGGGSVTISASDGESGITQPAAIYLKTSAVDTTECLGFDLPLGGGHYFLGVGTRTGDSFPVTWASASGSSTEQSGFLSLGAGWSPLLPSSECHDREVRYLEGGGGVMRGSFTGPCTGCCPTIAVSWSVCREGAACPPPPPLPADEGVESEPPTDCDETRADRAQLDLKMDQLKSVLESLEGATAEYARIEEQAAQWQGDFNQATWDCRLWGTAQMLGSFLLGNFSPKIPGRPLAPAPGRRGTTWTGGYEPGKAFANVLSMLDKVLDGESSWLLPDQEFDALFGASAEDVWDGFTMGLDAIGPSAPQDLRAGLQSCGAPTLNEVLDGAYEYLRLLEQVKPLADRMHSLLNNARDLDESIFDFCLSHAQACEDYERCR